MIKPLFGLDLVALWNALGAQGPKADYAPQLSDQVQPVVIVADTSSGAFASSSEGGESFMATAEQGPVAAGHRCHVQLHNPAGSGKNLYVDDLVIWSETAGFNYQAICWHNVALAAPFVVNQANKNWHVLGGSTSPVAQVIGLSSNLGVAHGQTQSRIRINGGMNEPIRLYQPFVIQPGYSMVIRPETSNDVRIGALWQWRER